MTKCAAHNMAVVAAEIMEKDDDFVGFPHRQVAFAVGCSSKIAGEMIMISDFIVYSWQKWLLTDVTLC